MAVDTSASGMPGSLPTSPGGGVGIARRTSMTEGEQKVRRESIKAIMQDHNLTAVERRKSIHQLMDGRRRSSTNDSMSHGSLSAYGGAAGDMAAAAAAAAAAFEDSSSDGYFDDDDGDGVVKGDGRRRSSATDQSLSEQSGAGGSPNRRLSWRSSSGSRASFTWASRSQFQGMSQNSSSSSTDGMTENILGSAIGSARKMEMTRPDCNHYERRCTIISPCCGLAFGCRICHDDCAVLPPPIFSRGEDDGDLDGKIEGNETMVGGGSHTVELKPKKRINRSASLPLGFTEEETHHNIDRFKIKEVICRECFTRQSSKANNCIKCDIQFSEYHCSICNLWMSADEEPYHCQDCSFCRVGGQSNFKHCHDCGMCIDAALFDDHNCKTGKYMSNCPVCQEDLFSSRSASHEMPCGHAIHWHCFRELTAFDTRCPVCKKTAETHDQMAPTWQAMAMGIALQPVPPALARAVTIICNDCEVYEPDRRWHFLGVQCHRCTSFNTTIESTQLIGEAAAAFLGDTDQPSSAVIAAGMDATAAFTGRAEDVMVAGTVGMRDSITHEITPHHLPATNHSLAGSGRERDVLDDRFGGLGIAEDDMDMNVEIEDEAPVVNRGRAVNRGRRMSWFGGRR